MKEMVLNKLGGQIVKPNKKQLNQYKQQPVKLTNADIDDLKEQSTRHALNVIIGFSMLALRDEYGFSKVRLERFHKKFMNILDSYNDNRLTVEDIHRTLEEETGIKFEGDK